MKKHFKKGFGTTMGVFAGIVGCAAITELVKYILNGNKTEEKNEEEKTE